MGSLYHAGLFIMDKPLIIGLTGGIASGKTTVSNLFLKLGVPVIDADVLAHALVQPGQPALALVVQTFGDDILQPDGHINRHLLRQRVFASISQRQRLEAILHPRILQAMRDQVKTVHYPYCLFSIPLLVETQQMNNVDRVLVVDCLPDQQRERLAARSGFAAADIERILAAQASRGARLAIADEVIHNDTGLENLEPQVLRLHAFYLQS